MNVTTALPVDGWAGYAAEAQRYLPPPTRLALLCLLNVPILAVVLNVLKQLILPRDPSLPPEVFHWLPYIGSAPAYGQDPLAFFFKCREKYGDVFTFILFGRKVTVALGTQGNNFVLGGKVAHFSAEDAYKDVTGPVFGDDVVYSVPNEVFMEQKKFVKFGLTTENFRAYVGMVQNEITQFMEHEPAFQTWQMNDINEWGKFDVLKVLQQVTMLAAARTLQGKEVRDGMDKSFAALYEDLDNGFTPIHFMFPKLPLPSYRKRDIAHKKMTEYYLNILKNRRDGKSVMEDTDMLAALSNQKYRDGRTLPDTEIAHIMLALLLAGHHTSSTTGSWALLHLASRPDIADAILEEQTKQFGNPDGTLRPPTYEELKGLPVLDSVIRETLRMHPPIHSIMRVIRADVPVPPTLAAPSKDSAYVVPKGHYVLASPIVSQMDPRLWNEAEKWEPSRWNDENGQAQQAFKLYADENGEKVDYGFGAVSKGTESPYQPFGAGRHRCIGEQFAYLQLGTLIVTIVRAVEMRLPNEVPKHDYHTMVTMPCKPREIHYRRRKFD
ncbi:cytochrome P450 [Stereum hirsutum FP-91666 SS1]|uniref:cytochrome P450 n=1 Tax=Stereum hirsutum (strain FP-91666) TaxID=721885 RepID=UPI000440C154|nr:cytochrome P450 [Stereum hirsutum FP-91666 SS1]EIM91312.1 cytochrome P450 [Stereum hirsutum FP-91666 SS1]